MDDLTPREKQVLSEMAGFARRFGRWGTIREIGEIIGKREGLETLSVASTFRKLINKGYISKTNRSYCVKGYEIRIKKADLVRVGESS